MGNDKIAKVQGGVVEEYISFYTGCPDDSKLVQEVFEFYIGVNSLDLIDSIPEGRSPAGTFEEIVNDMVTEHGKDYFKQESERFADTHKRFTAYLASQQSQD